MSKFYFKANSSNSSLNILAVKAYGEAEFWLSGGKVSSSRDDRRGWAMADGKL